MEQIRHRHLAKLKEKHHPHYRKQVDIRHLNVHRGDDSHKDATDLPVRVGNVDRYFHHHFLLPNLQVV